MNYNKFGDPLNHLASSLGQQFKWLITKWGGSTHPFKSLHQPVKYKYSLAKHGSRPLVLLLN